MLSLQQISCHFVKWEMAGYFAETEKLYVWKHATGTLKTTEQHLKYNLSGQINRFLKEQDIIFHLPKACLPASKRPPFAYRKVTFYISKVLLSLHTSPDFRLTYLIFSELKLHILFCKNSSFCTSFSKNRATEASRIFSLSWQTGKSLTLCHNAVMHAQTDKHVCLMKQTSPISHQNTSLRLINPKLNGIIENSSRIIDINQTHVKKHAAV